MGCHGCVKCGFEDRRGMGYVFKTRKTWWKLWERRERERCDLCGGDGYMKPPPSLMKLTGIVSPAPPAKPQTILLREGQSPPKRGCKCH